MSGPKSNWLAAAQLGVRSTSADQFDAVFVRLMSLHYAGAVRMADQEWHSRGDPRLKIMAHATVMNSKAKSR
jgi:uncharacterized protein (DUF305 family)